MWPKVYTVYSIQYTQYTYRLAAYAYGDQVTDGETLYVNTCIMDKIYRDDLGDT